MKRLKNFKKSNLILMFLKERKTLHSVSYTHLVRSSGSIKGSGAATIVGPKGKVAIKEGVIVADRHIHFSDVYKRQLLI